MDLLRQAAQALVDRWDTPLWKDVPHTGVFIDALRAALAEPEPCADESDCDYMPWCRIRKACQKQVRAALAQPEQEPVAWINEHGHIDRGLDAILDPTGWTPLYLHPPQRKPLTDEQIAKIDWKDGETLHDFARAIEKAHGIGGES